MTPALKAMVEAMRLELERQFNDPDAFIGWYARVEDDHDRPMDKVDGNIDLEKVARAGLEAIHYTDQDKQAFIATADRHEIRPLVLIAAYNEILDRALEP